MIGLASYGVAREIRRRLYMIGTGKMLLTLLAEWTFD